MTDDKSRVVNAEEAEVNEKKEKSLIGMTIMLDPRQGGMFSFPDVSLDGKNALVLSTFDNGIDRFKVKADMAMSTILKGIKYGILRVLDKNGKDVSTDFGGQLRFDPYKPLVTTAPKPVNPEVDKHLLEIINTNDLQSIKDRIMLIRDRETLNRLKELEEKGENPAASSREYVLSIIQRCKESIPGPDSSVTVSDESQVQIK